MPSIGLAIGLSLKGGGIPGAVNAQLVLSGTHSIAEDAATGTAVGTLSVSNGNGVYTFAITLDADNKFAIDGDALEIDQTLNYETATSHQVTVEADNTVDDPTVEIFTITVTDVAEEPGGDTAGEAIGLLLALTKAA